MELDKLKGPVGWSALSILVILVLCFLGISSVLSPLLGQSSSTISSSASDLLLDQYEANLQKDIDRFNGRSPFFKAISIARYTPPTPPPVRRDDPPDVPDQIVDTGPPPPPSRYMGPTLIAIIGNEAWFRSPGSGLDAVLRIKVGEETQGVKVISTKAPSVVTVEHRGGVYPIPLFESKEDFFAEEAPPHGPDDFLKEVEG
jgi:hypothetical protein